MVLRVGISANRFSSDFWPGATVMPVICDGVVFTPVAVPVAMPPTVPSVVMPLAVPAGWFGWCRM